ncbi:PREDICTED: interferon alpha-inducible protein 27-like protein 2B [Amphimedon queenslandica]|uniref:Uncharacterized protein n=1 Tax=Amphimedon queenslandica TaxID=400682 RepID=A0AAN0IL64_AMPQE|nr:PREDICTED: interferon alpha-inducible protein 27-like protein 2B [Amphimedon queenslandica]|eukprot:XP_011403641.1 PREDICTED: interferon alpha-inducible protein 27-like protein 2B [Amphimedon queenslandica]
MLLSKGSKALFLLYLLVSVQAVNSYDEASLTVGQCYKDQTMCPSHCRKYNDNDNMSSGYSILKVTIGGAVVLVAAPHVLSLAGFTTAGIAAGGIAASLMGFFAPTVAGGLVATLQSLATAGIPLSLKAWLFSAGTLPPAFMKWFDSDESDDYKNLCCCKHCPF